jgi:hypothetical protein
MRSISVLLHQLHDLRHDRLLLGGGVALGIEFAGALGVLALQLGGGQLGLVDRFGAGAAFDLLLLALVLLDLLGLVLVYQPGFEELVLQRCHSRRSI